MVSNTSWVTLERRTFEEEVNVETGACAFEMHSKRSETGVHRDYDHVAVYFPRGVVRFSHCMRFRRQMAA